MFQWHVAARLGIALFRSLLPGLEQSTVVCHVSVVTVDFQATSKDVLVRSVVRNAPTSVLLPLFLYLLNTSFFSFFSSFLYVTCPCSFWTKRHVNLFVNNNVGFRFWYSASMLSFCMTVCRLQTAQTDDRTQFCIYFSIFLSPSGLYVPRVKK